MPENPKEAIRREVPVPIFPIFQHAASGPPRADQLARPDEQVFQPARRPNRLLRQPLLNASTNIFVTLCAYAHKFQRRDAATGLAFVSLLQSRQAVVSPGRVPRHISTPKQLSLEFWRKVGHPNGMRRHFALGKNMRIDAHTAHPCALSHPCAYCPRFSAAPLPQHGRCAKGERAGAGHPTCPAELLCADAGSVFSAAPFSPPPREKGWG